MLTFLKFKCSCCRATKWRPFCASYGDLMKPIGHQCDHLYGEDNVMGLSYDLALLDPVCGHNEIDIEVDVCLEIDMFVSLPALDDNLNGLVSTFLV